MRFSEKLIQLRKDKGWTQAIAARNINIQQSYLSKLENGRYVPSEEVLSKICEAYGISRNDLPLTKSSEQSQQPSWLIALALGLTLLVVGQFELFFSQTYYTYQVTPVEASSPELQSISYHLSDEYSGEKYVTTFDGVPYEYSLIASRHISRKENRWLIAGGLIILIFSAAGLLINRRSTRGTHANKVDS